MALHLRERGRERERTTMVFRESEMRDRQTDRVCFVGWLLNVPATG